MLYGKLGDSNPFLDYFKEITSGANIKLQTSYSTRSSYKWRPSRSLILEKFQPSFNLIPFLSGQHFQFLLISNSLEMTAFSPARTKFCLWPATTLHIAELFSCNCVKVPKIVPSFKSYCRRTEREMAWWRDWPGLPKMPTAFTTSEM